MDDGPGEHQADEATRHEQGTRVAQLGGTDQAEQHGAGEAGERRQQQADQDQGDDA